MLIISLTPIVLGGTIKQHQTFWQLRSRFMSNVQKTEGAAADQSSGDTTLGARRLLAWIISFVLGGGVTALGILFVLKTNLFDTIPISTIELPLLPVAALPMGLFFLIWVDY